MSEELEVLKLVAQRLESADIPYMVTGSIACNFYTLPRMTRDIDIVIELKPQDAQKVYELFSKDFYIDKEAVKSEIARRGMFNIIHNKYIVKVDFIVRKDTEYRKEEFLRRRQIQIENEKIFLTAPEDLIISKLEWAKESHSEMQLKDVKNLLDNVKNLDYAYLEKWTTKLGLSELLKEVAG
jgi:hypothetical protein